MFHGVLSADVYLASSSSTWGRRRLQASANGLSVVRIPFGTQDPYVYLGYAAPATNDITTTAPSSPGATVVLGPTNIFADAQGGLYVTDVGTDNKGAMAGRVLYTPSPRPCRV